MNHPPKFFLTVFRWYCHPELVQPIEGDLLELYEERIKEYGKKKANWLFIRDIILLFRKDIIKPTEGTQKLNYYGMIKNDIKTSLRIMKREKLYSAINILGLSAGFTIAVLILFFVRYEQSYEEYNPNADKMIRITMDYLDGETLVDQDCETYHLLGPMIQEEFPEVVDFTRAFGFDLGLEINGKVFKETSAYAVDPSFLSLFGYPLLHGDPNTALKETSQIVLTKSAALKFFGKEDAVGEIIKLNEESQAQVVGIVEDSPLNTHLKFSVLLSYSSMNRMLSKREDPWDSNDTYTYLSLRDAGSYPQFVENLSRLSNRLRKEDHIPDERIISEKIRDIHLYSNKSYEPEQNGSATLVYFLLGVALSVILIAVLNYINLATAKAMDRAKEAGIRKVVGSTVGQLRVRFFIESILLNLFAGLITIVVTWLIQDSYKQLAGLPAELNLLNDLSNWILLGVLLVVSTVLSGIVPAFSLGSFKPLEVLKGRFTHSSKGIFLRKALVTAQFAIAIFLLIQTFVASQQLTYMLNKDLGMDTEKVVVISSPPQEGIKGSISSFKNSLLKRSAFLSVGASSTVPGLSTATMSSTTNIKLDDQMRDMKNNFFFYHVDSSFLHTMKMELVAGSDFTKIHNYKSPFLVNEEALRIWGIADPQEVIHKKSSFWGNENTVVGVVKDFHQLGAKSSHIPMIFFQADWNLDFISVRLGEGPVLKQLEELEEVFESHFPTSEFEFFFLDQNFDAQYKGDKQFQQLFTILSGFAILITCLGLFGLATFALAKRTKEIGIRKVLGASIPQIVNLLSKEFIILVGISSMVAIPITWFLVSNWLSQYSFRIGISAWLFVFPTLMVLLIAFFTVFSKAYEASRINPAISLRDE